LNRDDNIKPVNPDIPAPELINDAARKIRSGGVVAVPTRCLYGLAADALNPEAVERVFQIKQRPENKPLLVLIRDQAQLNPLVKSVPVVAGKLMDKFWPGQLTLVFSANDDLPLNLTAGTAKIGIRIPEHPVAVALVNALENPITGTSANLSDDAGCSRISDLNPAIVEKLDFVLDAGPLKGGIGSTVVDVTTDPPTILRQGVISARKVMEAIV
jgi:L-threonylcarbamoyladenylate synthase